MLDLGRGMKGLWLLHPSTEHGEGFPGLGFRGFQLTLRLDKKQGAKLRWPATLRPMLAV